jgi:Spy/CpxP family protein refolding chaperone
MKKLLLMFAVTAFIGTAAVAQDQKQDHAKQKAEWQQKIKDDLKLTPEQAAKFDALNKEYDPKFDALGSDATLTKEAQKEKKIALKKEKEAKLQEFLTAEQRTKYKEIMERKKTEMKPAQ